MTRRLIDADALKERKFPNGESEYVTGWNDAISAIMTFQPTVDAEPVRHGKWIFETIGKHGVMTCSECLKVQDYQTACFTYCPNCGARMDKE